MSLETGEILRAAFIPRGYYTLLPDDIDPVAKRIARKQRMSRAAVFILSVGETHPTPREALGMLYFAQIVKTADNVLDRDATDLSNYDQLRQRLLSTDINGIPGVSVNESLEACLECYSPEKQRVVNSFLNEMVSVHLGAPQKGVMGAYTFDEAQDYRRRTNDRLVETLAELTGSKKEKFVSAGRVWQLLDDALDWAEDSVESNKNLYLGMATDTWHDRGEPEQEDVDYLRNRLKGWRRGRVFDFRVQEFSAIKSSRTSVTRARYKQRILDELPLVGGNSARIFGLAAQLVF